MIQTGVFKMNRNNIWIHIGLAVVLITMAAVLGQIGRWRSSLESFNRAPSKIAKADPNVRPIIRTAGEGEPEVLVRFHPDVTSEEIARITARLNDRVEDEIEIVNGLVAIDDLDDADAAEVAAQYASMTDRVLYAEPNFRIELDPTSDTAVKPIEPSSNTVNRLPNDPLFNEQWALQNLGQNGGKEAADIGAVKAWMKTSGSEDVVVAVLDTGVDYTHKDLAGNMWMRPDNIPQYVDDELGAFDDLNGFNAGENAADPMDTNGHGTHCAGVIGAEGDNDEGIAGVNWKVKIMPLKFLGRGGFGTTKDAIEAINYAVDRKQKGVNVRVISASWGSTMYSKALEDAIRAAGEQGILFVAAAGNSGTDNDRKPHYPSNYDLPNVISVAALDRTDSLASFSNFGPKTVHIAAPGKDIVSSWLKNAYREASGTSMATPQVSGVAALVIAADPDISMEDLREKLLASVDKIDSLEGKITSGGRLNAAKAVGE